MPLSFRTALLHTAPSPENWMSSWRRTEKESSASDSSSISYRISGAGSSAWISSIFRSSKETSLVPIFSESACMLPLDCSFSFFREDYAETGVVLFLIFRIGLIKSAVLSSGLSTGHLPIASEGISYKMAMPVPFRISPCLSRPEIRCTSVSAI